ncbi:MAG: membrane-flanked domain protein, partial [Propionibacterium sp.]
MQNLINPDIASLLLVAEGEELLDETGKHWIALVKYLPVLLFSWLLFGLSIWWYSLILSGIGVVPFVWSAYKIHCLHMDRFVITNMRIMRVYGVFEQKTGIVPLNRILDVSVKVPFWGMIFGYG